MADNIQLEVNIHRWPVRGSFTIASGSRKICETVSVTLKKGRYIGRGESVANAGMTTDRLAEQLLSVSGESLAHDNLSEFFAAGRARNALDCAFWDLRAKMTGLPIWQLADLRPPKPVRSAYTISLADPDKMASAAKQAYSQGYEILKIKVGQGDDLARLTAVRAATPQARIVVDANAGWDVARYLDYSSRFYEYGVELIEQPLPSSQDDLLSDLPRPIPLCADESSHDRTNIEKMSRCYDMINIKLDKCGGFSEALLLKQDAKSLGMRIMVGCMLAPSLAVAPAFYLAQGADFADIDGPLLLAKDWPSPLLYNKGWVQAPDPALWG